MPAVVRIPEKSNDAVFTLGELFPTGSAIDVLSSGQLTLWRDGHEHLGVLAEHEGRTYVATPLGLGTHPLSLSCIVSDCSEITRPGDLDAANFKQSSLPSAPVCSHCSARNCVCACFQRTGT